METLQRTANRGSVSTGYDIDNSVKMEPDNGERFDTGNKFTNYSSVRKFTVSVWLKRTELTVQSLIWFNVATATSVQLEFNAADKLSFLLQDNVGNGVESYAITSAVFRDTSAWYHVVLAVDTTDGTAADRTKIYVNGVNQTLEQGNGSYDTFPAQNYDVPLQTNHYLLGYDGSNNGFRGYVAEYYFLDGITASPTDFGEFDEDSGIWKPIEYTGSFGNEGYYLDFEDASALGKDVSSNNQGTFTFYNGSAADQATDTPTNNFTTFNPLLPDSSEKEGATVFINPDAGADTNLSTIAVANGKWYAEFKASSDISGDNGMVGVAANSGDSIAGRFLGQDAWSVGLLPNGSYYINSSATSYLGTTFNQDIISVALDMDNKKVYFAKNGTWGNSGNPATGTNGIALPSAYENYEWFIGTSLVLNTATYDGNYGGYTTISISSAASDANGYGTFEYAPPSGYYALCSRNLSELG